MKKEQEIENWYALYVSSRAEKKTAEVLANKGIQVYLPLIKTLKQWSDRKKMVEIPLFNGYVFVRIRLSCKTDVLGTKGVVGFVRHEGLPAVIRSSEIDAMKSLISSGYDLTIYKIDKPLKRGDDIKILGGILKDMKGTIINEYDGCYFEISVDSIGYNLRVKLPSEILLPVK